MTMTTMATLALRFLLLLATLSTTTHASPIKDVTTAYLPSLSTLLFFGGFDNRTPFLTTCGLINLSAAFSVDAPPITPIPALPAPTSRLVPMIRDVAGQGAYEVLVSNGITNYQLGNTTWTYVVSKNAGGGAGPAVTVTQPNRAGRQVEWVPYAPAYVSAATYPSLPSDMLAIGGRVYPDPFVSTVRKFDVQSGGSAIVAGAEAGGPLGRADAGLTGVNVTHVVLVGGYNANVPEGMRDIWLLNVPQMRWTRSPHQTTYPRSHLALVTYKSFVVVIGREAPLIEVINVAVGDAPRVAEIKGSGPITLEATAATVVGDQIILLGGNTKVGDPDQRFVRVLKVKETGASLAFEWMSTFTPPQAAPPPSSTQPGGVSPPVTTDATNESSPFPIAAVIGASIGGVAILAGIAFFVYRRGQQRSSNPRAAPSSAPTTQPPAHAELAQITYQPPVPSSQQSPMYPMPPKTPVATVINMPSDPSTVLLAAASAASQDKYSIVAHGIGGGQSHARQAEAEAEEEVLMLPPANPEVPPASGGERDVAGTLYLPHATSAR
ncbi:hypothetical protein BCR44DRAFT_1432356 [Catenaria anguillulae PL171]|uniref:Uncharacterized protein n=1 Tax=Catenaria anguillulae PL171 TaxID=765915 RepID=A0A1Y2HRU4_9FUNG|nr:hypothetical protein BCR44DRAFT_1432356 [Catenaria anguillulae PL171]